MRQEEIIYKPGDQLTEEQLYVIAKIDNEIPLEFNPLHEANEKQTLERIKFYKELLQNGFFQAAFSNEKTVAFHALQKRGAKTVNIVTLWVHPSFRNKGIAKKLKTLGTQWARSQKCEFATTSVHTSNDRMVNINKKAGFEVFSLNMRMKL